MINAKNPLGYKLHRIKERHTGEADLKLVEKDGGNIFCPFPSYEKGHPQLKTCTSNCAWFFTKCNIPDSLGLDLNDENTYYK